MKAVNDTGKEFETTGSVVKTFGVAMNSITKEMWGLAAVMAAATAAYAASPAGAVVAGGLFAIGEMTWLSELLAEQYHPSGPSRRPTAPQKGWWPGGGAPDPYLNQQPRKTP